MPIFSPVLIPARVEEEGLLMESRYFRQGENVRGVPNACMVIYAPMPLGALSTLFANVDSPEKACTPSLEGRRDYGMRMM